MLELCRCPNIYGPDCIYRSKDWTHYYFIFFQEVTYSHQAYIYLIKILIYFINLLYLLNVFYVMWISRVRTRRA